MYNVFLGLQAGFLLVDLTTWREGRSYGPERIPRMESGKWELGFGLYVDDFRGI
jgi:hypothetical protein